MTKTSLAIVAAAAIAAAGCHWNKPAQEPESSDESESSSKPGEARKSAESSQAADVSSAGGAGAGADPSQASAMGTSGLGRTSGRAEKAVIRDDTEKATTACSGTTISDLIASLSQAACELPANAAAAPQPLSKAVLEVTLVPESTRIAPGSTANVRVIYKNKGKASLALDFTVDPDPRFVFELYTPKGARVDKPPGNEPALPAQLTEGDAPETRTARVTLAPDGTATAVVPWRAVRYKWASKEKAKGAIAGHGYPREPAGPVARGKYFLRLVTPLTNVDEGAEHELTRPHANVEIAGTLVPEAPPVEAPRKAPPRPAPAAAAATSDATIEAQFLKAAGAKPLPPAKKH
jgi:hypothetical protein